MASSNGLFYQSFSPPRDPEGPVPAGAANDRGVRTRFLIMSDTHGKRLDVPLPLPGPSVDVAIHCGDLTQDSHIDEFVCAVQLLKDTGAPIKIVIAGNRDVALDLPLFRRKLDEAKRITGPAGDRGPIKRTYGDFGDSMKELQRNRSCGIFFLHEGTHRFTLPNGACLKIFASPCTPSADGQGAFTYSESHMFDIEPDTDLVMTHGPPRGILDLMEDRHMGCPHLFAAVARAQPKMHCFGHVHQGWGAKLVTWQPQISQQPSHDSDIDDAKSRLIEDLDTISQTGFERPVDELRYRNRVVPYKVFGRCNTSHCAGDEMPLQRGQTLFVNAALQDDPEQRPTKLPWLVDLELPPRWSRQDVDQDEDIIDSASAQAQA